MPEKLTLNNGAVLEDASAILSGDLFLYIKGQTLEGAFDLLIVPENTERIIYTMSNGAEVVYEGFRRLIAVRDEGMGLITAVLRKEEA